MKRLIWFVVAMTLASCGASQKPSEATRMLELLKNCPQWVQKDGRRQCQYVDEDGQRVWVYEADTEEQPNSQQLTTEDPQDEAPQKDSLPECKEVKDPDGLLKRDKVRNTIRQALLFLRRKKIQQAQELLEQLIRESCIGASDPLTWLALAKVHWTKKEINLAGLNMEKALKMGAAFEVKGVHWAENFIGLYRKQMAWVIIGAGTGLYYGDEYSLYLRWKEAIKEKDLRDIFNAIKGCSGTICQFKVQIGKQFFLPHGNYEFKVHGADDEWYEVDLTNRGSVTFSVSELVR